MIALFVQRANKLHDYMSGGLPVETGRRVLMQINNNNFQKNANASLVAQFLFKHSEISRVDIARELSLYRSTVTNIVSALIKNGIVYEVEEPLESYAKTGRKPIMLRLNEKFGCVVGVDIQPSHYRIVVIDMLGTVLGKKLGQLPEGSFEDVLHFLMDTVIELTGTLNIPLLGVCIGIPGIVNSDDGIIKYAEPFKVVDFDVLDFFQKNYDVKFLVENDANCCAWLEMTKDRRSGMSDFISIFADSHEGNYQFRDRAGVGIGIGLSIGGKVYHGATNAAGEFCSFSWRRTSSGQMGLPLDVLETSASSQDSWLQLLKELFSSMVPVVSVMNPSAVYLHGKPFADSSKTLSEIRKEAPQFLDVLEKTGCQLVIDGGDEMVVAKGAAMMFLQRIFAVPELRETETRTHFDWDDVIDQAKKDVKNIRRLHNE